MLLRFCVFLLMRRRPPRSTQSRSSAASDVYKRQISSYDELLSKFDHEINRAVQGYVLNSWYNHWSSILIEHIFKLHRSVLPTVGQIKNVDFFINDVPFDLKVTYFPSEYLKQKRRERGLPVELTFLKSKARDLNISYNNLSLIHISEPTKPY